MLSVVLLWHYYIGDFLICPTCGSRSFDLDQATSLAPFVVAAVAGLLRLTKQPSKPWGVIYAMLVGTALVCWIVGALTVSTIVQGLATGAVASGARSWVLMVWDLTVKPSTADGGKSDAAK